MFKEAPENLLFVFIRFRSKAELCTMESDSSWRYVLFLKSPGKMINRRTPYKTLDTTLYPDQPVDSIVERLLDSSPLPPSGLGSLWTTDHETFTVSRHVPTSRALALPWVMKSSWRMRLEALFLKHEIFCGIVCFREDVWNSSKASPTHTVFGRLGYGRGWLNVPYQGMMQQGKQG